MENDERYIPVSTLEELKQASKEYQYTLNKSIMGQAMNITDEELEGKDARDKTKYILQHGYSTAEHITLIKALYVLSCEVDELHKEIDNLKYQLNKKKQ